MFSYASPYPFLPSKHRRGGPVHVEVILRDLEVTLVERYLAAAVAGPEEEFGATPAPAETTSYPRPGAALSIAENTVKVHRVHVMAKMEAGSIADLVRMALTLR